VSDGIGRAGRNPGFELLEVVGDCRFFLSRSKPPHGFDLEREPPSGLMGAEHEKYRGAGQNREFGPDRQQVLGDSQE